MKSGTCQTNPVHTLVLSEHQGVRDQLVAYLALSPQLTVSGDAYQTDAIQSAHPRVIVLDLSRVDPAALHRVIDLAAQIGAHLIALASVQDPEQERAIVAAGGLYLLKTVGSNGLAEKVLSVAS